MKMPPAPSLFRTLNRFARTREERCELCAVSLGANHQHLLDPSTRAVLCSCDGCAVVFDEGGRTKYKRIPRDPRRLCGFEVPEEAWLKLLMPVKLAFFYRSSYAGKPVGIFPSPMGATESTVDEGAWAALSASHPLIRQLPEDVEALLVSKLDKRQDYLLVPIDRCFALVGLLRKHWQGINGGDEVWPAVRSYLEKLREIAR